MCSAKQIEMEVKTKAATERKTGKKNMSELKMPTMCASVSVFSVKWQTLA